MSLVVTSDGLTVTATLDTSGITAPYSPIGVYINWGDDSQLMTNPNIFGDEAFAAQSGSTGGTGSKTGQWTTDSRFTSDPTDLRNPFYMWHGTMSQAGNIWTATHTYASAGDFEIYAGWLDEGQQEGTDDNYIHGHVGFYAGQPTTVAPATGATHRINVTARNVDHWSWSLDGGPDNMMPPGSTYADITI